MKPIVLASSSPRRKRLLSEANFSFIVDPSQFDESTVPKTDPYEMVKQLSAEKAREVAKRHPNSIIIGADTTVVCQGEILEKPRDYTDARRMLRLLSGTVHTVITGVTVLDTGTNKEITRAEASSVFFKTLSEKEIDAYVKTGEAMDKAGAYAIQEGLSQHFIVKIEGDYTAIVGLPVELVKQMVKDADRFSETVET